MAVAGNYVYVADRSVGLRVVDVSDRANPVEVGFYAPRGAWTVAVAGNYAYTGSLRVLDVSNPANPTEVGFYEAPELCRGIEVAGDYAYCISQHSLSIVDISNPANPRGATFYEMPGLFHCDVAVAGDYVYLPDLERGLLILRWGGPASAQ